MCGRGAEELSEFVMFVVLLGYRDVVGLTWLALYGMLWYGNGL